MAPLLGLAQSLGALSGLAVCWSALGERKEVEKAVTLLETPCCGDYEI